MALILVVVDLRGEENASTRWQAVTGRDVLKGCVEGNCKYSKNYISVNLFYYDKYIM